MLRPLVVFVVVFTLLAPVAGADTGTGSVSLTQPGMTITQPFNDLATSGTANDTLPTGWYLTEQGGGLRDNEAYAGDTGASATGDTYSYGTSGERAFGGLQSGSLIPLIGAKFTNNTGNAISSLTVSYTGEEWRLGMVNRTDQLNFEYSLDATSLTTGTYTAVTLLNFTTPNFLSATAAVGAQDGNVAPNRTDVGPVTIPGLSIPNGASFYVRFTDVNASGADDGLAVDDFKIRADTTTGVDWAGGRARMTHQGASVTWRANPQTYAGFRVLRSRRGSPGRRTRVSRSVIAGFRSRYRFRDARGRAGDRYYVVARRVDGGREVHGPFAARPARQRTASQ